MMSPAIDPVARNIVIITTTLTALMIVEYIWCLPDEIRLVWPRFWKTQKAKSYVVTRYAGLAGQGFNVWFAFRMVSGVPNSPFACKAWSSYQTAIIQYLLVSVEALLMVQVYKMYQKDKSMFALLCIFGSVQCVVMGVNARLLVTGAGYSPTCITISPHHSRVYVGVSIIVTFMFILVAMLWRFFGSKSGWSEAPCAWLNLAVRDGSCTIIAITVIMIFVFLFTTRVIDTEMNGNTIFYVLLFCLWFAAGRIVLHQEKFRKIQESKKGDINDPSQWTQTIEVELDGITSFYDPDTCLTSLSGLEVESTEVTTPFDSDVGTRDIADEHLCKEVNVPPSSCAPTFMLIEKSISGDDSGSRK